jgi:hypothetical protein
MRRRDANVVRVLLCVALSGLWPVAAQQGDPQRQWDTMSAEQRQAWQLRQRAWEALPLAEREDRRARYAAWRGLDSVQQARLRTAAEAFAALPVAEQAALRARFDTLDAMQQRGWRLGPALGADWPRLQPLFAFVPPDERVASLSLLRQLDAEQRDDLAALAQRLPPQDREAFRRDLLAVPTEQRGAWLRARRAQ